MTDKTNPQRPPVTAFISRYATTCGIEKVRGHVSADSPDMLMYTLAQTGGTTHYAHKGDWWLTEVEARADAQGRIKRKLDSHFKSIAKLEKVRDNLPLNDQTGDAA